MDLETKQEEAHTSDCSKSSMCTRVWLGASWSNSRQTAAHTRRGTIAEGGRGGWTWKHNRRKHTRATAQSHQCARVFGSVPLGPIVGRRDQKRVEGGKQKEEEVDGPGNKTGGSTHERLLKVINVHACLARCLLVQ